MAAAAPAILTMENLLGISLASAKLIESFTWPMGAYAWQISDFEVKNYTIKADDHPNLGKEAAMLTISLTCLQAATPTLKSADGKPVSEEEAAAYAGKVYKENIMFGNDGLPGKSGAIEYRGMNMTATLLTKMLGAENYSALAATHNFALGPMLEAIKAANVQFVCELSHNINPKDPNKRVNAQINLFGSFGPVG